MERLWLFFFFFSVIAYSVIMGALMASGKEVSGKIPKGKASIKTHCFSLGGGSNACKLEEEAVKWTEVTHLFTGDEVAWVSFKDSTAELRAGET